MKNPYSFFFSKKHHLPHSIIMQNLIFFILILIMVDPTSSTPSPPRQQINNILDALIGATDFSAWISILSSANGTLLPLTATLFIPRHAALDRPPPDPFLLPYHVVPQRLPFSDLLLLPRRARLPTLLAAKTISVTDNSPANFSLDHTPLTHPDLFSTPSLAVHGVQSFLDYSLFGDGLPPSPPPSAGHSIDSFWNSGASSSGSHINGVVLLPLFSFVLALLLCQGFSISPFQEISRN